MALTITLFIQICLSSAVSNCFGDQIRTAFKDLLLAASSVKFARSFIIHLKPKKGQKDEFVKQERKELIQRRHNFDRRSAGLVNMNGFILFV